jgi:16S rRNA (guanine527-N7)-methyltransferase
VKELAQLAYELFGVQLNAKQLAALEKYEKELLIWNAKYNLTAIRDHAIRSKHF